MGFFYRTIRIVENGLKPAYVFDGKPPDLKSGVVSGLLCCIYLELESRIFIPSLLNDSKGERRPRTKVKKRKK